MSADSVSTILHRQSALAVAVAGAGLDGIVFNPGPTLHYLTGLNFHLMERPVVLIFRPGLPLHLVIPELEARKVDVLPFPATVFFFNDDPSTWAGVYHQAVTSAGLSRAPVGVEPTSLRYLELKLLEDAAPATPFIPAETVVAALRMRKDEAELAKMRKAVQIAQQALIATLPMVKVGITERAIAAELTLQLLRAGCDSESPFAPIVSSGPNSANPHATPTDRPLADGDLLVIDWGASYEGYVSDLTRTFAVGRVEAEFERIHQIVQQANAAGRAAGGPGVPACEVDKAAREVIEEFGYGQYFTHRTGHGLGMQGHEPPYMRGDNTLPLGVGMTYTVEPGIYLPDRGGVRIEDDVVVTATGVETLSDLPRQIQTVG
jgi:Xaa-Pro dipeptidase